MNRSYEMMYIIRPDMSEDRVRDTVDKYKQMLADYGSMDVNIQILGKRRLAYPIDRFQDGIYVLVTYQGTGEQVAPVERSMRLSEEVIRYLTLKLSDRKPKEKKAAEEEDAVPVEA